MLTRNMQYSTEKNILKLNLNLAFTRFEMTLQKHIFWVFDVCLIFVGKKLVDF